MGKKRSAYAKAGVNIKVAEEVEAFFSPSKSHYYNEESLHDSLNNKTEIFNGYKDEVAHLYSQLDLTKNF